MANRLHSLFLLWIIINTFSANIRADSLFSDRISIDTSAPGAVVVQAADIDRDGDMDIVACSYLDSTVAWYENSGNRPPQFVKHVISNSILGVLALSVGDIDGDGFLDVAATARDAGKVYWFRNSGGTHPVFNTRTVDASAAKAVGVFVADLDGDDHLDIAVGQDILNIISWYRNDGQANPTFTRKVISQGTLLHPFGVAAADVNGDGHVDVLGAFYSSNNFAWFQNDGMANPQFMPHVLSGASPLSYTILGADMNGDFLIDLVTSSFLEDRVAVYLNGGGSTPDFLPVMVSHAISSPSKQEGTSDGPLMAFPNDLDGDGDRDLVVASRNDKEISWYENDGGRTPYFTQHIITNSANGAEWVFAADLDNDGDQDIISASQFDGVVGWYENHLNPVLNPINVKLAAADRQPESDSFIDVGWKTNLLVVGTAVRFELWSNRGFVKFLGTAWNADGNATTTLYLPPVEDRNDYFIRALSLWDPKESGDTGRFRITGGPLRIRNPKQGDAWLAGSSEILDWVSDPDFSGTGARIELWNSNGKVTDLGLDWAPAGHGIVVLKIPNLANGPYFVRLSSTWDDRIFVDVPITITGGNGETGRSAVRYRQWTRYE